MNEHEKNRDGDPHSGGRADDSTRAAQCAELVDRWMADITKVVRTSDDGSSFVLMRMGTAGFVSRDGHSLRFPGLGARLLPDQSHLASLSTVDYTKVSSDLLRVTLAAIFDAHEGLPAVSNATGVSVDIQPLEVFDPAAYYGDREADLAMTALFGGFTSELYASYQESWPLADGHFHRRELYNLYHVLNHHHLFGGGYGAQAQRLIARLLAA